MLTPQLDHGRKRSPGGRRTTFHCGLETPKATSMSEVNCASHNHRPSALEGGKAPPSRALTTREGGRAAPPGARRTSSQR